MTFFGSLFLKKIFSAFTGSNGMFYILVILLAVMVLPNYNFIKEKLGFETKNTLIKKLENEQNKSGIITEKNKDLNNAIDNLKESKDNAQNTIIDNVKKEKIIEANSSDIVKRKNQKIEQIKKDIINKSEAINSEKIEGTEINKQIETESPELEKIDQERAISAIQLASIWEAYCLYDGSPDCSKGLV